jgi:hypothetical protein
VVSSFIEIFPGETEGSLELPIATDGVAEGEEGLRIVLDLFGDPIAPVPLVVDVVIQDA